MKISINNISFKRKKNDDDEPFVVARSARAALADDNNDFDGGDNADLPYSQNQNQSVLFYSQNNFIKIGK